MITNAVLAGVIFILMYAFIVSEKIHRTIIAMIGAILMIFLGVIEQETAIHHIDFNTLGLLIGMMIIVGITGQTGLFNYVAVWAAKKAEASPMKILIYLSLLTAVFSAFLDNVTTVLLMVPVTLSITEKLKIDPIPFLITQIIASNVGGTATLIGDPPNIMIGSAVKELTFIAFIDNLAFISVVNLVIVLAILAMLYKKCLKTQDELKQDLMKMDEKAELIEQISKLDSGFETLYDNIRKELLENKDSYKEQIWVIQQLVSEIMDKSVSIEAIESRNKAAVEMLFQNRKKSLQHRKTASSVARHYQKTAKSMNVVNSQFFDNKK